MTKMRRIEPNVCLEIMSLLEPLGAKVIPFVTISCIDDGIMLACEGLYNNKNEDAMLVRYNSLVLHTRDEARSSARCVHHSASGSFFEGISETSFGFTPNEVNRFFCDYHLVNTTAVKVKPSGGY